MCMNVPLTLVPTTSELNVYIFLLLFFLPSFKPLSHCCDLSSDDRTAEQLLNKKVLVQIFSTFFSVVLKRRSYNVKYKKKS